MLFNDRRMSAQWKAIQQGKASNAKRSDSMDPVTRMAGQRSTETLSAYSKSGASSGQKGSQKRIAKGRKKDMKAGY